MIDIAQDGAGHDGRRLKAFAAEREMRLATYADVTVPGNVAVGDAILAGSRP